MGMPAFVTLTNDEKIEKVFSSMDVLKFHIGFDSYIKKSKSDLILILAIEQLAEFKINPALMDRVKGLLIKESKEDQNMADTFLDIFKLAHLKKLALEFYDLDDLKRMAHAWDIGAQCELIAAFKIISNSLIYLNACNFERIILPVSKLAVLKDLRPEILNDFEIDKHGSFIYWPKPDIHLDLESFKVAANPRLLLKKHKFDKKFGKAIRVFREKKGLKQTELGLSDKQIRRFESGEQRPTLKAFETMAKSHEMDLKSYLEKLSDIYRETNSD
jgi:hypothetical protein